MSDSRQDDRKQREWSASRAYFPAGSYDHPPSGMLQLRVVRSGSSRALIDLGGGRRQVFTRPGDLLVTMPDRATRFEIEGGRELTMVEVSPGYASALLEQMGFNGLDVLLPLIRNPVREPLIAELLRRLEEPETSLILRDWMLCVSLGQLGRRAREIAATPTSGVLTQKGLEIVKNLVANNSDEGLSLARLAEAVGLTPRKLSAEFREATGLPVHQYILVARAERAVDLLVGSDLPLSQVAAQAGFSHQAHMSRVLRRLKGHTPGKIRSARSRFG